MTQPRTWTIYVAFAGQWLTANKPTRYRYGARSWRDATRIGCINAKLPTGMQAVTIHGVCWYVGARPPVRDSPNLHPTFKAIVDGLSPTVISARNGRPHSRGGYGLIPDDSDRHVRSVTWELRQSPGPRSWVDLTITEVLDG